MRLLAPLCLALGFAACTFPEYAIEQDPYLILARICSDERPSSAETGIDCGGGCPPCQEGDRCEVAADCLTLACVSGTCRPATCDDGTANGSETDTDCGGQCARPCDDGRSCRRDADCESLSCSQGSCRVATCTDMLRDGRETGVDCGGPCPACPTGSRCTVNADCAGGTCEGTWCVDASCTDGARNGRETDVDCGGPQCAPCEAGGSCRQPSDCVSTSCDESSQCADSSCDDGIQNGSETDVDCGGESCPGCGSLLRCATPADCASGVCQSDLCVPASPTGELVSTDGWTGVASHSFSGDAPSDVFDRDPSTVWSTGAVQEPGMLFELDLGRLQAFYTIEFECPVSGDAPGRFDIYAWHGAEPTTPARADIVGFPKTVVEFSSPQVARYIRLVLTESKWAWWCMGELSIRR